MSLALDRSPSSPAPHWRVILLVSGGLIGVDVPLLVSGPATEAVAPVLVLVLGLHFEAKILIMDGPTAALGPQESHLVGDLIRSLKAEGLGYFLISHNIH